MEKLLLVFLLFGLLSCLESDVEPIKPKPTPPDDIVTDASGREYPFLDPNVLSYCGPGWGRKFCRFLGKYDDTVWVSTENSDSSSITFYNFTGSEEFISFVNFDNIILDGKAWRLGENTYDGSKWDINIKKDQKDVLWFSYDHYGAGEEIEYTIIYKCEVVDGLLIFSSNKGQEFIFSPS